MTGLGDVEGMRAAYPMPERASTGPFLRANMVASLDGAAVLDGRSGTLGDAEDQRLLTVLRTLADLVLVGARTIAAEGYGGAAVSDADAAWRASLGHPPQPRFAIVSTRLGLGPEHPFFAEAVVRPIVVTSAAAPADRRRALSAVADLVVAGDDRVDLPAALRELAAAGFARVLSEGGPSLLGELVASDLVDELCLTVSPMLVAGGAMRLAVSAREAARAMRLVHAIEGERMLFLRYARDRT